jgi:hypothetical protein
MAGFMVCRSENGWFFPQPNDHGNFGKMRFKPMKFGGTDFGTDQQFAIENGHRNNRFTHKK